MKEKIQNKVINYFTKNGKLPWNFDDRHYSFYIHVVVLIIIGLLMLFVGSFFRYNNMYFYEKILYLTHFSVYPIIIYLHRELILDLIFNLLNDCLSGRESRISTIKDNIDKKDKNNENL